MLLVCSFFFFKQKTAYEVRISDWSSDVCSSDLNCSHCRRKGFLLTFVPIDQFRLTGGADRLTSYMFNKHNIDHQFCDACGCQSFSVGTGPDGSKMAAVNLRCVPEADLDALTIQKVDGASF